MINKIKNFVANTPVKMIALFMAIGAGLVSGLNAFAAVDTDVASTTASVVTTMKENLVGVITANIANIVIVAVLVLSITFVWRLAKRFIGGR